MLLQQYIEQELQASGLNVTEIGKALLLDSELQKQRDGKNFKLYLTPGVRGRVAKFCGTSLDAPHFTVAFNKAVKDINCGFVEKPKAKRLVLFTEDEFQVLAESRKEQSVKASRSAHSKKHGKENLYIV